MYRIADVEVEPGAPWRCYSSPDLAIHENDLCVVEHEKRTEFGKILKLTTVSEEPPDLSPLGKVLRRATLQDRSKADENALMSRMARTTCEKAAEKHALKMRILRLRYSFDRSALWIQFSSEDKLDYREMVKDLSLDLRTRIELTQIGVRDEAGMIGGIGTCGRQLCCCSWLRQFESINVKMAKTQGLSLNPSAIGGNCGRLKCCLNYEFAHYRQLTRGLPHQGSRVETPSGSGFVFAVDILAQRLKVRLDEGGMAEFGTHEIKEISGRRPRRRSSSDEDPGSERTESKSSRDA